MPNKMNALYFGETENLTRKEVPKVDKFERGYIYILNLSNGYTKIGSTADPYERMRGLKRGLRSTSVLLETVWISVSHINYKENEKSVLQYLEGKERDGEFFKITFDEANEFVKTLEIKTEFTLEEIEAKQASRTAFISALNNLHEMSRQQKK